MFNDWTHLVPSIGLPLRRPLCVFLITHLIKTVFGQSYNLHVQGSVLFPTNGCWVETHELFSYIFLNFKSLIYERFYFIWKKNIKSNIWHFCFYFTNTNFNKKFNKTTKNTGIRIPEVPSSWHTPFVVEQFLPK